MKFIKRVFSSAALGVLLLPVCINAQTESVFSHLRPEHAGVVRQWLTKQPNLRLATEADCTNKDGLAVTRGERGKNYYPYYAVADFNGDREPDFAVVLIKKRPSKWKFAIAVFNGPLKSASAPAYFGDSADLSSGGLFVGTSGKRKALIAGVFESDDCVILKPLGKTYIVKDCLSD